MKYFLCKSLNQRAVRRFRKIIIFITGQIQLVSKFDKNYAEIIAALIPKRKPTILKFFFTKPILIVGV